LIEVGSSLKSTTTVLVHSPIGYRQDEQEVKELQSLVACLNCTVYYIAKFRLRTINSKHHLGSGQLAELSSLVKALPPCTLVFNSELTPTQQKHIQQQLCVDVVDRTQIIFALFAKRATSHLGKIQVELASLRYASTRLVGGWTHLERQRGGIGLRGGPGESQLEIDRRLIKSRIRKLERQLIKLQAQQAQNRKRRVKNKIPIIGIMGYTNAGKTTLYNALTKQSQFSSSQIFATLDPKAGRLVLPCGMKAIVMDTVGFVRDLPHSLLDAFRATLDEIHYADLICIVIDSSSEHADVEYAIMQETLESLELHTTRQLCVYNKKDLSNDDLVPCISISAFNKSDVRQLADVLSKELRNLSDTVI